MEAGGSHVSPSRIIRMDRSCVNPHAAPQCPPSARVGSVELWDCPHSFVWAPDGRYFSCPAAAAKGSDRRTASLRMVWRYAPQSGGQTADAGRHDLFWAVAALDRRPVERHADGSGPGRDELGGALCGVDPQRGLSGLRHARGVDRLARQPTGCVAAGMVAPVAPGAARHPTGLDGPGAGGPRLVGTLALPAYCPPRLASPGADQPGREISSGWPDAVVLAARVGGPGGPGVARSWYGLRLGRASARLHPGGVVGRGLHRPMVAADGSGA